MKQNILEAKQATEAEFAKVDKFLAEIKETEEKLKEKLGTSYIDYPMPWDNLGVLKKLHQEEDPTLSKKLIITYAVLVLLAVGLFVTGWVISEGALIAVGLAIWFGAGVSYAVANKELNKKHLRHRRQIHRLISTYSFAQQIKSIRLKSALERIRSGGHPFFVQNLMSLKTIAFWDLDSAQEIGKQITQFKLGIL